MAGAARNGKIGASMLRWYLANLVLLVVVSPPPGDLDAMAEQKETQQSAQAIFIKYANQSGVSE